MKIVSWNAKVGRPDAEFKQSLRNLIADTDPDVICLQEAGKYTNVLRESFSKKWYVYAKSGWDESTMNPVLVKKRNHRKQKYGKGWGTVRTKIVWEGPQGGEHTGRTWTQVKVDGVRVMSLHRCTGGRSKNEESFVEEYNALTTWIKEQTKPVLVFGDHNCGPNAIYKGSSRKVADAVDGVTIYDPQQTGIDYAIAVGVRGTVRRGKAYGSDHDAMTFTQRGD